jgi:phosphate/sulfate permease
MRSDEGAAMTVSSITEKSQAVELYGTQAVEGVTPPEEFRVEENNTNNDTRTEMRTEQKKKDGGCAKIFSMILQIAAAVVAVALGPKGVAIAAALNAAAKAIAPDEQTGGSTNSAPVDTSKLYSEIDEEAEAITRRLMGYLPPAQQSRPIATA